MSRAIHPPIDASTQDAVDWLVLLRSGEAAPDDHRAFDLWLHRDARHRTAWERLTRPVDAAFAAARSVGQRNPGHGHAVAQAMASSSARAASRRRLLRGALAVAGVGAGTAAVSSRFAPLEDRLADFRTGTGERRLFGLADGTRVLLNARSAMDRTPGDARSARLRGGEALADVSPNPLTPFSLMFRDGSVQVPAMNGHARFLVRQERERSLVVALEQRVRIAARADGRTQWLEAGSAAWIEGTGVSPAADRAAEAHAWTAGRLTAYDRPLGEVVDALSAYRRGFLRISPDAARVRVYGSYPLDDTDRALAMIAETLPVAVHMHSAGWLVRIELA